MKEKEAKERGANRKDKSIKKKMNKVSKDGILKKKLETKSNKKIIP